MKKTIKRTLPLLLAAVMLLSTATLGGLTNFLSVDAHAAEYQVGDIVEFGSYPQTEVKDEATLNALNSQSLNWISYGYYSGNGEEGSMIQSDYMKYADATYNGTKYRAVKFTEYRPYGTTYSSSDSNSKQDDNGYKTNTTYWFKYEPIKWRILNPDDGFIMCETIIDSQPYSNSIYLHKTGEYKYHGDIYDIYEEELNRSKAYWNDTSYANYANNYAKSSIRAWLNDDFYNLAFTSDQKSDIKTTTLDNSAWDEEYSSYDSATTNDKVFLLSYTEVLNSNYGFNTGYLDSDAARIAQGSDYAKCQGLNLFESDGSAYDGNVYWYLRSPGESSKYACEVVCHGYVYKACDVISTDRGIRPALKVSNLSSLPKVSVTTNDNANSQTDENGSVVPENGKNVENTEKAPSTTAIIGIAAAVVVVGGVVAGIVIAKKKK